MNGEERLTVASELIRLAKKHIVAATESPDPVAERRESVEASKKLRKAAEILDDEGRLS
jgi:hypothetical protein